MERYFRLLENNLYFLNKEKRIEIINKYKNKYKDYINNGDSENEALNKLGNIDDIVKKICNENNLNYSYCMRKNSLDKDITNISRNISDIIKDIIKVFRSTMYGINIETFLITLIKIFVLILIFLFLKIPVVFFQQLAYFINKILFYPIDNIFNLTTELVISVIYIFMCSIMTIKVLGNYVPKNNKNIDKEKISVQVSKDYSWLEFILRIIIYLIVLIPLYILIIIGLLVYIICLYLISKGISIIGIPITILGLTILLFTLKTIITDSLKHKIRNYIPYILISIIITIFGIICFVFNYNSFKYHNDMTKSVSKLTTDEVNLELDTINSRLLILKGDYQIIEDSSLEGNNVRVSVTYYDDYVDVFYYQEEIDRENYLVFESQADKKTKYRKIYRNVVKDLKRKNVFNYANSRKMKIVVYANKEVKEQLEK